MDEKELIKLREQARDTYRVRTRIPDYKTDQQLKKPQPPLAKAPMCDTAIPLPTNYEDLDIDNDFLHVINSRESHRVYTQEQMTLLQLSYLLWCTQGVKTIRGKSYATLRTVPCGGGRHPFECYMTVQMVDGLADGLYHYLPLKHAIEYLGPKENMRDFISASLVGQAWGAKANVVFYYSIVFYRCEWRYGVTASPASRTDAGHVTENLYLACTSIGLGGCAVGAIDPALCNEAFGVDGEEEFIFYAMPVGTISAKDRQAEDDFYAFVREDGL